LIGVHATAAEGVLRRGNRYEPTSLDPHKINTQYEKNIVQDLFEGLVTYDAEGHPGPGLASSWSVSPEGTRYTFRLRPGLMWSDGAPLTSEDALYSFRRLMDPKTAGVYAQLMYLLKNGRAVNSGAMPLENLGVSAPDPATVILELEAPAPYLPEILANAFAVFVPRHVIMKTGEGWTRPGVMVSNGAFTLDSWEPQNRIALSHNPRFYDAPNSKLARVVYTPTADLNSGLTRFRAGELDMQLDFPLSQIDALRAELQAETRLTPTLLTYYLALNTQNPKFTDVRVRRALSLAVDRDILTTKVLRAGEQPAYSFVPPQVAGYEPARMDFADSAPDARLAEAKRLLAEAGYPPDKPLKITYSHSSNLDLRRIAVVIAGMWKRAGVETQVLNTEGKVHFANMRQGDYEVAFAGWSADFNDASSFLYVLQSSSTASNYSRYRNPAFDALMTRAAKMENAGARAQLLHQAEETALHDQPVIPLYYGVTKSLVSQRVIGWRANAVDVHLSRYLSVVK
jgi:oligopeptide transport system substrate-binding protein